jgi:hypothetical protein
MWSVRKNRNMGEFYAKLRKGKGAKRATVAVARKIVTYAYWMLKRNLTY